MKKNNGHITYSPSDLINFMESTFITWMDRYFLEFPVRIKPDDTDEALKILQKKGREHEDAFLNKLKEQGKEIVEIPRDGNSHTATMRAMSQGKEIIYQANLFNNDDENNIRFEGYADFLFKVEGTSKLGNWYYEPWDTKLALKSKPYFIVQLCAYAEMLKSIQDVLPKKVHIVLGDGEIKSVRTDDYFYYYKRLKKSFLSQQANFDHKRLPELSGIENYGRWSSYAEKILKEQDHLSLVANIKKVQIKKFQKNGINTLTQLARTSLTYIPKMDSFVFESLKKQALLQLRSAGKSTPEYEVIKPSEADPKRGLALLPCASTNDVWFDMEGYPHKKGGLEYLFGVTYLDNDGTLIFKDWWAHDTQQEKQAFQAFVSWVYKRWQNDPSMHIYHYASYEVTALKRLMGYHGSCEDQIDDLLRNDVFIDLYKVVREGLWIGEPKYSLKNIEHLYMDVRTTEVAKATDSIVYYERWLECKDGNDWQTSALLKSIRDYNEEDCLSTKLLCDWLRNVQHKEKINYILRSKNKKQETLSNENVINKSALKYRSLGLAQKLLESLEVNSDLSDEQKALIRLQAHLLEFHRREDKPMWWAKFDRQSMKTEQLIEDINCLGGLERTESPKQVREKSYIYEYKFDCSQDSKLKVGDSCYVVNGAIDNVIRVIIEKIDMGRGLIGIKIGVKQPELPKKLNLIPDEFVNSDRILESIFETVDYWYIADKMPNALKDFLLKRKPRILNHSAETIITGIKSFTEEIVDVVSNMENTTLCIQGPPGSGKTHTAAHVIVELIRNGRTVGITSNGHKAIAHLIDKVLQKAEQNNIYFPAVKIQSDSEDFHVESKKVDQAIKADTVFSTKRYKLIGGTAWAFSNSLAKNHLDYLFVDEAGQVSTANLFGMVRSTKNIVLMGDQMQLSQPIKGSHPGESGKSCLEYYLEGHQTIPKNIGVFLDKTYRLHPNICKFISSTSYENRLESHESTSHRLITLTEQDNDLITKNSGLLFIPVEHEDNNQSSDEEVEVINKLINILLRGSFKDVNAGNIMRSISFNDILIVAPYNIQVSKIKESLPQEAKVGSVDKFQGQEAPIVIISMCSSNANDASRGLEFVLNKNRINVAISRAQVLAIVVGSPSLADVSCKTPEQMELVNLFCKILEQISPK